LSLRDVPMKPNQGATSANELAGLAGVCVLELGNMVSAAYACKLVADLGADASKLGSREAAEGGVVARNDYSNMSTVRATSPDFIARNASFTSSSLPRLLIMSSRLSRFCR